MRGRSLSVDDMTEFWEEPRLEGVLAQQRFEPARITAVVSAAVEAAEDPSDVAIYRHELSRLATRCSMMVLCVYDVELVGDRIVGNLLRHIHIGGRQSSAGESPHSGP
jgi:hypothetical protein